MKKILIVDDEINILKMLSAYLYGAGFNNILTASNALEALDIVVYESPDIVLLDNLLPDFKGMDIIHLIKKKIPNSIVLIITGLLDREVGLKCLESGADDFITKPIDVNQIDSIFLSKGIIADI